MGSSPTFFGAIAIAPPLQPDEISHFNALLGPNLRDVPDFRDIVPDPLSEIADDPGRGLITEHVEVAELPPYWYCHWRISEDGTRIVWNREEKFRRSEHWMAWLLALLPDRVRCSGRIIAIGENIDWFDAWHLDVEGERSVTVTRYNTPWFSDDRWEELEDIDPDVPELIHEALVDVDDGRSDGTDNLSRFFDSLAPSESDIRGGLVQVLLDLVEIGAAPSTWRTVLEQPHPEA